MYASWFQLDLNDRQCPTFHSACLSTCITSVLPVGTPPDFNLDTAIKSSEMFGTCDACTAYYVHMYMHVSSSDLAAWPWFQLQGRTIHSVPLLMREKEHDYLYLHIVGAVIKTKVHSRWECTLKSKNNFSFQHRIMTCLVLKWSTSHSGFLVLTWFKSVG